MTQRYYCTTCLQRWTVQQVNANKPECLICKGRVHLASTEESLHAIRGLKIKRGLEKAAQPKKVMQRNEYLAYLAGDLWKLIKREVLERDKYICQACEGQASVVHHKSYDQEVMDGMRNNDLVSLCKDCHEHIEFYVNMDGSKSKIDLRSANKKLAAKQEELKRLKDDATGKAAAVFFALQDIHGIDSFSLSNELLAKYIGVTSKQAAAIVERLIKEGVLHHARNYRPVGKKENIWEYVHKSV